MLWQCYAKRIIDYNRTIYIGVAATAAAAAAAVLYDFWMILLNAKHNYFR